MWAVGINITSSILLETPQVAGDYGFGPKAVGYIYLTPIVAVTLGELFGHFFNDFMANLFMIPGLTIVNQALEKHLHYAAIIMGWGMYVFGVMIVSVAITAYALDCYPTGSAEVSAFVENSRVASGFLGRLFPIAVGSCKWVWPLLWNPGSHCGSCYGRLDLLVRVWREIEVERKPLKFKGSS